MLTEFILLRYNPSWQRLLELTVVENYMVCVSDQSKQPVVKSVAGVSAKT